MDTAHPLADRFWKYTDKRGDDECWPWNSYRNTKGYARITKVGNLTCAASRVAWEIHHGETFPADKLACHSCDNPGCVNPHHIWPGTPQENKNDCVAKDRNPRALSREERAEVCRIHRFRCPINGTNALAKRYGVHPTTIARTVYGSERTVEGEVRSLLKSWKRARPSARQSFLNQISQQETAK